MCKVKWQKAEGCIYCHSTCTAVCVYMFWHPSWQCTCM